MKHLIRYLIWFLLLFAGFNLQAQNNTVYGAGISYTNGVPSWTPNPRTSRAAVDTVTGRWYHFNTPGGWQWIGNTVEEIAGCAAPAYTPSKGDSRLVINNCVKPEVYWYDGTVWKWINQGEVYTAGQGIRIESNTIILDSLYVLRFRTGSNTDGAAGTMSWNATEETLDLVTDQGAVTGHLMESAYYNTRNTTGTPITIGTVVMANGTTGNTGRILIAPAIANGTVNSEYILGLAAQTIGNNSNGKVQHFGKIRGIQTNGANFGETWVDGDVLYCSATTPGYLTKLLPTAPNLKIPIAIVIHAHPSNGTLFVRPSHFPDLAQINDVQLTSPTNGQVLTYNSTLSRWENATPANQLQTLSTNGSAGNISISSGNTITLNVNDADASTTNELQTLSVAANTATLSNSGGSVTIAGAGINTVGTAGTTITVTGTEVDGSTTNELQTLSTGTNTLTLSNGGGTVTVDTDPTDDVTGSGTTNRTALWTGTKTLGANVFYGLSTQSANGITQQIGSYSFYGQIDNFIAPYIGQGAYAKDATGAISPSATTFGSSLLTLTESDQIGLSYYTAPVGTATTTNIFTNSFLRFRVSRSGNTGIGGVTTPAARFHVVGSGTSSSTWTAQFHNSAGNNNALMIRDDGNVGIGTSSPAVTLDVFGRSVIGSSFSIPNVSTQYFILSNNDASRSLSNNTGLNLSNYAGYGKFFVDYTGSNAFTLGTGFLMGANNRNTNASNNITGGFFIVNNDAATARASTLTALKSYLSNSSTNSLGNAIGVDLDMAFNGATSSITNYYGAIARVTTNSGVMTNTYGFYVDDITKGTQTNTPYSFYASDANAFNYFAGRTGIGTTSPNASAILDVSSTTQGVLFPRMTTAQRDLIATPADGLVIYNTTDNKLQVRAAGAWVDLH